MDELDKLPQQDYIEPSIQSEPVGDKERNVAFIVDNDGVVPLTPGENVTVTDKITGEKAVFEGDADGAQTSIVRDESGATRIERRFGDIKGQVIVGYAGPGTDATASRLSKLMPGFNASPENSDQKDPELPSGRE